MLFPLLLPLLVAQAVAPDLLGPAPADTLRVYLVRHGQARSNLEPRPAGSAAELDHLTPQGRDESRKVGLALRASRIALVLISPTRRTEESAAEIRAGLPRVPVRVEPRLRSLELGRAPDGRPLTIEQRVAEWKAGRDPAPPGGESMDAVGQRVMALLRDLQRERTGRSVVLVSHGEVIGSLVGLLEGKPSAARYPSGIATGSLTLIELKGTAAPALVFASHHPAELGAPP